MSPTFRAAALHLLAHARPRLPDLSGVLVLVPHRHVIAPFLAALRAEVEQAVFVPPRFATLPELAEAVPGPSGAQADSVRLVELYAFLGRFDWLDQTARWPLAQALQGVLAELDAALLHPPATYSDFCRQVEMAARRSLVAPLEDEARLVFELWRAFHSAGSTGGDYALRLARWLEDASPPVFALGLQGLSPLERRFLAQCAARIGLQALPTESRHPQRVEFFQAAWNPVEQAPALRERAFSLARAVPVSPLAGSLALHAAADLEAEAARVALQIAEWLDQGRRAIAVIALDRMAARRLRAILERHEILIQDETGWTFTTAAVGHVLDRWLSLVQDDFYHADLLDLLKSPFVFADWEVRRRRQAVADLELAIRATSAVAGLDRFRALARLKAPAASPLLARLADAERRFRTRRRRPLGSWLAALRQTLDDIAATPAFEADPAGSQLLARLHRLERELAGNADLFGLAEWRAWLNLELDRDRFRETDIESPLRLTHLAAARLRDFDAVVILGADASHLPDAAEDAIFNDALRGQLGLPGRHERRATTLAALTEVLAGADRVLVTWQAQRNGDPNPPSPWVEVLDAFHRLAYGTDLHAGGRPAPVATGLPAGARVARPAPSSGGLPSRLSASAWQALVSCPYRWYGAYVLGLGEAEEVAEEMEKADYGEVVHAILAAFHTAFPTLAAAERPRLRDELVRLGRDAFAGREAGNYLARAWRLRWERRIDAYLDWALAWEAAGHAWRGAEQGRETQLELTDGRRVTLHGRLDRLDEGRQGLAVLDYKTQARQALVQAVHDPAEHVQLPFYGVLTGAAEAALVGLDEEKVVAHVLARPLQEMAGAERARLTATLSAVAAGAALPAHGAPSTCSWCEMRGLCRRDWFDAGAQAAPPS